MANKAERGTKRVCGSCESKFYDLNKDPITCPMCGTVFALETAPTKPPVVERKVEKPVEAASEAEETETVSLDEVAASEEADVNIDDEDVLVDLDDDDEVPSTEDDDTFLEADAEGDDDVTDIVGGAIVKGDEET